MPHPFSNAVIDHLDTIAKRLFVCLESIDDDKLWVDFSPNLTSPGNLILHLVGNLNQYVLKAIGGKTYIRQREKEFSDKPGISKAILRTLLEKTVKDCIAVITALSEEQLTRVYTVQGFEHSGYSILVHVTEHISHHTGQFTWFCKYLFSADPDYYKGHDLNVQ